MAPKARAKRKESAEQRRVRQEMEALAAAEEEAARQAAAAAQLRETAAREAALTAINSQHLNAEWLQRMRAAKLEELQAEAKALSRQHDAAVDRRDRLIEALLEDLAAQNTQHDAAATAHCRMLEELLELHRGRLGALHTQFSGDLRVVQEEFESEKAEMAALHHRAKKELGDIMAALQQSYEDTRAEAAASYRLQEEEVRNRSSEAYNITKLSLEARVQELQGAVEQQHRSYQEATEDQGDEYRQLAAVDAEASAAIAQRTERLRHLQETLQQWRGRIVANSNEWQRRNAALATEKEILLGHHTALKAALAKFRSAQEAKLKQMCVSYANVEGRMREHLATAQRIVRIATLCRKHELPEEAAGAAAAGVVASALAGSTTQDGSVPVTARDESQQYAQVEPAQPQPATQDSNSRPGTQAGVDCCPPKSTQSSGDGDSRRSDLSASACGGGEQSVAAAGTPGTSCDALAELGLQPGSNGQRLLDAFVNRMNRAVLDSAALEQEQLRLTAENATLHAVIKAVQEGSSVGPGAVDDPLNTLLVVNQRLQCELGNAAVQRLAATRDLTRR